MESSKKLITAEVLRLQCDNNFKDGDHVDRIEPLIQELLSGKTILQYGENLSTDSISIMKDKLHDCHSFLRYIEDIQLKNRFFQELENLHTWEVIKNQEETQIYSKREPGMDLVTVFYRIKLPFNLLNPFALLQEIHLMKKWVPDITKLDKFQVLSQFRKAIHVQREMPFPLSDREFVVCSTSLLVKERKGAMVMIRSINDERQKHWDITSEKLPLVQEKVVRADIIKGYMYVEHIDEKSCWFHGFMNINPKIQFMPDSFISFVLKKIVGVIVKKLQKESVFQSQFVLDSMEEQKEFYDMIRATFKEWGIDVPCSE